MIFDKDTNFVYISHWLPPTMKKPLRLLLEEVGIQYELLKCENDYWARDFMPIQLEEDVFIKYRYWPDYLLKSPDLKEYITDCAEECERLGIRYTETDIIIDGGNVVPCGDYIVMTDKVFTENHVPKLDKVLTARLEKLFGHEVIFIPWHRKKNDDEFGHSDGFVKYVGGNRILIGNHREGYPKEADAIRKVLENYGFDVTELAYDVEKPDKNYNWAYINFLQVGNQIIMPTFGIDEDEQAEVQIQKSFPSCDIHGIPAHVIADKGGALHCITWNIKL